MFLLSYARNLLCACWHPEAMKGSSSLTSCRLLILSRLVLSLVWAQLTLLVPALGSGPPFPKMAPPFTGSAHTPLPESGTIPILTHLGFRRTVPFDPSVTHILFRIVEQNRENFMKAAIFLRLLLYVCREILSF